MKKILLIAGIFSSLFSLCSRPTLTDADGNTYHTVKIGNQVWTVENYRATKFNDGTPIPQVRDSVAWHFLSTPGYCFYGNTNNADTIKRFGAFYNWYCNESKKLAPPGWHVATNDDWEMVKDYLINHGYNWDGVRRDNRIAKAMAAQNGWKPFGIEGMPGNNMQDNNKSGFSAIAAGFRYDSRDSAGWYPIFKNSGHRAAWWSATENKDSIATVYGLGFCTDRLIQYVQFLKTCGYPVRLVKNRKQ